MEKIIKEPMEFLSATKIQDEELIGPHAYNKIKQAMVNFARDYACRARASQLSLPDFEKATYNSINKDDHPFI